MDQLEQYLRGIPLNEENAALLEGRDPALEYPIESMTLGQNQTNEEITDEDREWLRRLPHEPGFKVFWRLLNNAVAKRERSAILLSSQDPISNRDRITTEWTYVACFKTVLRDIELMVQQAVRRA